MTNIQTWNDQLAACREYGRVVQPVGIHDNLRVEPKTLPNRVDRITRGNGIDVAIHGPGNMETRAAIVDCVCIATVDNVDEGAGIVPINVLPYRAKLERNP